MEQKSNDARIGSFLNDKTLSGDTLRITKQSELKSRRRWRRCPRRLARPLIKRKYVLGRSHRPGLTDRPASERDRRPKYYNLVLDRIRIDFTFDQH